MTMKTNTTVQRWQHLRTGFTSLYNIAAISLLAVGLTVASRADILYAEDAAQGAIYKFASDGILSRFAPALGATGLAFDNTGNLYVSDAGGNQIVKITPGGVSSVFANTGLNSPYGLAFDSAGNLYAANQGNNTIAKFTPGGVGSTFATTGLNSPYGLAFDSMGNLFAANGESIAKFTPGGAVSVFAGGLNRPYGLAFDSTGNLYVSSVTSTIEKFTSNGVGTIFANSGLSTPVGLAFDSAGNLYAANNTSSSIEKFTPAGVGSEFFSGINLGFRFIAFTDDAGNPLPLANQVPEPTSLALILGGAAICTVFPRRRRNL